MSLPRKITVDLPSGSSYEIHVGKGALASLGQQVKEIKPCRRILLISDATVGPVYAKLAKKRLEEVGFEVFDALVPAGEQSKSLEMAGELYEEAARCGLDRSDLIVACGGGVVGDLAGFVASTYKRGIDFVQVPTTLLAMVDASIGGKTAVDLEAGKNLVGTFHQPLYICTDTRCLHTLSDEDWANGFAEIVKSAFIAPRRSFYEWLRDNAEGLVEHDDALLEEAVVRTAELKASVVAADEKESGLRECLNFGHTLAHAIETVSGYGSIGHGRAVAEGMRFAARLSVEAKGLDIDIVAKLDALLDALGLEEIPWTADAGHLYQIMLADKKARAGRVRFVLLNDIASWSVEAASEDIVMAHLNAWCASKKKLIEANGGVMWTQR